MVDKRRNKKSGKKSGRRGVLSTNGRVSLPLRFTFSPTSSNRNTLPPKSRQPLLESSSYITRIVKPFQDMTISLEWLFCRFGGELVVVLPPFLTSGFWRDINQTWNDTARVVPFRTIESKRLWVR